MEQLGRGKEGTTYLLKKRGKEYALKTFRRTKSGKTLQREADLQKKASKYRISPKVYSVDLDKKTITMEKLDCHLYDSIVKTKRLSRVHQERILSIYELLDNAGVFHNDANLSNYMLKNGEVYIIDFGMAREITPKLIKKLGTDKPNQKLMLLGFILKIKELGFPLKNFKYLVQAINSRDRANYGIEV